MDERFFDVEIRPGEEIVLHFRPGKLPWLPPEAKNHVHEAQKEMLLALRSLIDRAIERVEEKEKPTTNRTKINIE